MLSQEDKVRLIHECRTALLNWSIRTRAAAGRRFLPCWPVYCLTSAVRNGGGRPLHVKVLYPFSREADNTATLS